MGDAHPACLDDLIHRHFQQVSREENVYTGLYRSGGDEYLSVVAGLPDPPILFLLICDKLLPRQKNAPDLSGLYQRRSLGEILQQLNRGAGGGIHELHEFSAGTVYAFRQCVLMERIPSDEAFARLLQQGVAEYRRGLAAICGYAPLSGANYERKAAGP